MPSMKTIKRRIASVDTTKKIMKAMDMVAAAKLQKARARLEAARPFADAAREILAAFDGCTEAKEHPFFKPRTIGHTAYLVIAGDRGLCGGYNTNVAEQALSRINAGKNEKLITVGQKAREYFHLRGKNILRAYPGVSDAALYGDAERIAGFLLSLYASGEVDEAYLAYTRFESALIHVPRVVKILPVGCPTDAPPQAGGMRYEPDAGSFLSHAAPLCVTALVYTALIESSACEQAARMVSMESAVHNAAEIIGKLTRMYNRKRQTAITQELGEIVSSADMLN